MVSCLTTALTRLTSGHLVSASIYHALATRGRDTRRSVAFHVTFSVADENKPNHKLRMLSWTLPATVANKSVALYGVQRYVCVEGLCLEVWLIRS